jgi:hypothetical protein
MLEVLLLADLVVEHRQIAQRDQLVDLLLGGVVLLQRLADAGEVAVPVDVDLGPPAIGLLNDDVAARTHGQALLWLR